ncbi:hypothetical protein M758_2G100700 [Ceratodon purpureus]|nr:hypothetical protein M758_2G100700 [Ceratodon purpureus]
MRHRYPLTPTREMWHSGGLLVLVCNREIKLYIYVCGFPAKVISFCLLHRGFTLPVLYFILASGLRHSHRRFSERFKFFGTHWRLKLHVSLVESVEYAAGFCTTERDVKIRKRVRKKQLTSTNS